MKTRSGATLDAGRIIFLLAAVGLGIAFWDYRFLWPLKMLVVLMHESGHALATWLVGGHVAGLTLASDQSGQCLSSIPVTFGAKVLVYSAGYVGSALAGALLLLLTFRLRLRRPVLVAMAMWLGVMAVFYAGDAFTLVFCIGGALVMALAARYLPDGGVEVLNLFLAAFSCLYVVMDLKDDLWNGAVRGASDAALLANLTPFPAVAWAGIWTFVSLMLLLMSLKVSMQRTVVAGASYSMPALRRG